MNINAGDTAWVLASAALVMFMTPGLAFFYGGMVRARNVLTMLMQNFFCLGLVSVLWAVVVYSVAFGGTNKWIGNLEYAWMGHFNTAPAGLSLSIPPSLYMAYQLMFAVITPTLITGAIADRVRFARGRGSPGSGHCWCTPRSRIGCSRRRAGSFSSARSTSRAAPWCTSTPGSPRWRW